MNGRALDVAVSRNQLSDMDEMTLAVVGIDFPNEDKARSNRRFELLASAAGDPVTLRPEPRNRHDPNAVAVFSARGVQVGYLSAERAPLVGARMRRGEEVQAILQGIRGSVAYIRVRFGGGAPTLPQLAEPLPERTEDDFFPDPEGPDWGA
ncbi:HIRAN domain-containing protein [Sphingomonas fuzhouensis]|uniref:HIRAN domain-containing protein n=1 Tax=Sphingomonas fuzhouensis TaxID=3106033 RepID=UPI002AFDEEC1|nr:HIRAN domain-containing protein [Sphingomonas sp. SGZ-02]